MADSINKKRRELRARTYTLSSSLSNALKGSVDLSASCLAETIAQSRDEFARVRDLQLSILIDISELKSIGEDIKDKEYSEQATKYIESNETVNVYLGELNDLLVAKTPTTTDDSSSPKSSLPPPLNVKMPELKVSLFSDNSKDPFEFFRFIGTFKNAFNSVAGVTRAVKLVYLKSYCRGRALSLIENLAIEDSSFDLAMDLLHEEFMDEDYLINQTLSEIINYKKCYCLESSMELLTFLKTKIAEIAKVGIKFSPKCAGDILLSNIVRSKLYKTFLQEISRKTGKNYPSLNEIMEHSANVYKLLKPSEASSSNSTGSKVFRNSTKNIDTKNPDRTNSKSSYGNCKLCSLNHSTSHCRKYPNFDSRFKRAIALGLCGRCLSSKHLEKDCPGQHGRLPYSCQSCRAPAHVTPMCPTMVLSFSASKSLSDSGDKK